MKYDYQVVTSTNEWVGGGQDSTEEEINADVKHIAEHLKSQDANYIGEELIVYKAPKLENYSTQID
jgi:uncharacterized protein (UPF0212 family)